MLAETSTLARSFHYFLAISRRRWEVVRKSVCPKSPFFVQDISGFYLQTSKLILHNSLFV